jgi:hypothetical protein
MALVSANQFQTVPQLSALGSGFQQGQQIRQGIDARRLAQQQLETQQARQAQLGGLRQQILGGQQPQVTPPLDGAGPLIPVEQQRAQQQAQGIQAQQQLEQIFPEQALATQQAAKARFDNLDTREQARLESVVKGAQEIQGLQPEQQLTRLKQRRQTLAANGQPTNDTDEVIGLLESGQADQAQILINQSVETGKALGLLKAPGGVGGLASAKTEFLPGGGSLQALPDGSIVAKDEQNRVVTGQARQDLLDRSKDFQLEIAQGKADIEVTKAGKVAAAKAGVKLETEPEIQAKVKQAETQAQKTEIREQASIDRGLTAADSTANIRRAISLLDTVETGGIDAALVRAKQIFGIEGADEGELSSNLGKAIISQLRETFGAAFTKSEGDKLDRIEAAFGKSPAANRRLLNNTLKTMERLANRGLKAAESREDDFAIQSINDALTFELGDESTTTRRIKFDVQGNIVQ